MRSCVPRGAVIFEAMNPVVVTCCVLAALVLLPAQAVRGVLATAAASLFEGTPLILAGALAQMLLPRLLPRLRWLPDLLPPLLGCGCGNGPAARSAPAAVATALVFGPIPAILRFAAATLVDLSCRAKTPSLSSRGSAPGLSPRASEARERRSGVCPERAARRRSRRVEGSASQHCPPEEPILSALSALLPAALFAGVVIHVFGDVRFDRISPVLQFLGGATFGFAASPCALGAVALAASLHARAPFAALGMLCTCGIIDLRALSRVPHHEDLRDALSYALLAIAFAVVVARNGNGLLNPRFTIPLALCSLVALALAIAHRRRQNRRARIAPVLMVLGALVVAPPPSYTATETTLSDLFPGERLTFTGTIVHGEKADALVRFAITCCRADAAPVVVRLASRTAYRSGSWVTAQGVVTRFGSELRLVPTALRAVGAPVDPFVYR
jgi:hypothetical protein